MSHVAQVTEATRRAADRLQHSARTAVPVPPVRELPGIGDLTDAYAVQAELVRRRVAEGARRVGWKIGLTNPAVQRQLGVDEPDYGVLLDDMQVRDHTVDLSRLIAPRAEAEVAVLLGQDLDSPKKIDDPAALRASVDRITAAIEIVDSRIRDWDITILDTIADNASSAAFVLGEQWQPLGDADLTAVTMSLTQDGAVVSSGTGRDCLGDPLHAVAWLARTALRLGSPLRAGDLLLTGALGPMVSLVPGTTLCAEVGWLGSVDLRVRGDAGGAE